MAVYGDYDVDGITSTCLLTDCLSRLGGRVLPYIPDRLEEGYGLNSEAVSALAAQGVTLIVTVDCGHHRRGGDRVRRLSGGGCGGDGPP